MQLISNGVKEVDWTPAWPCVTKRDICPRMDEYYKNGHEDVDWCYTIRKNGYLVAEMPFEFRHIGGLAFKRATKSKEFKKDWLEGEKVRYKHFLSKFKGLLQEDYHNETMKRWGLAGNRLTRSYYDIIRTTESLRNALLKLAKQVAREIDLPPDFFFVQRRKELLSKYIGQNCEVIDFGCGNGAFSFLAHQRGKNVVGLSLDEEMVDHLNRLCLERGLEGIKFKVANILTYSTERKYDYVIFFDVMEHIVDDDKAIRSIEKLLKVDGKLLLSVPNREAPSLCGDYASQIEDGSHVRQGYTFTELEAKLSLVNMKITRRHTRIGFFSHLFTSWDRFARGKIFRLLEPIKSNLVKRGLQFVFRILLRTIALRILYLLTYLDILCRPFWTDYQLFVLAENKSKSSIGPLSDKGEVC